MNDAWADGPNSTCVLVGKAYRAVYRSARAELSDHAITPAQFILLDALWTEDGRSSAELGTYLGLDSASMTGLLDRSTKAGLIERRPDATDRRVNRIWLTDKSKAIRAAVQATMTTFDARIAAALEIDLATLNRQLALLAAEGQSSR